MAQYAIRFEFDSRNTGKSPEDYSLKKEVEIHGKDASVVYLVLACPVYYRWREQDKGWQDLGEKAPTFKRRRDSLIFVFNDKAASSPGDRSEPKVEACGVSIEFAQSIAPFDDDVTASIRMTATTREREFPIIGGPTLRGFVLDWSASLQNPAPITADAPEDLDQGFAFESAGKYDYTVSLLTFFAREGEEARPPKRYWLDPEMDIDN